jgi:hypothetical protein
MRIKLLKQILAITVCIYLVLSPLYTKVAFAQDPGDSSDSENNSNGNSTNDTSSSTDFGFYDANYSDPGVSQENVNAGSEAPDVGTGQNTSGTNAPSVADGNNGEQSDARSGAQGPGGVGVLMHLPNSMEILQMQIRLQLPHRIHKKLAMLLVRRIINKLELLPMIYKK